MTKDPLDLGLIAVFKAPAQVDDPLSLVRLARDYGFRGVRLETADTDLQRKFTTACQTFSLTLSSVPGQPLPADIVTAALTARTNSSNAAFEINLTPAGKLTPTDETKLKTLNQWLHYYGHAFYEGRPSKINTPVPNLVLQNGHAPYQIYLFVKIFSKKLCQLRTYQPKFKK